MKKKPIVLTILIVLLATASVYQYFNNYYLEGFGYDAVPDSSTAQAIAEAVIKAEYGEEVLKDKTLTADYKKITGFWYVKACSEENQSDHSIEIVIRARNGKIMKLVMSP
jgi:hypothetical protein